MRENDIADLLQQLGKSAKIAGEKILSYKICDIDKKIKYDKTPVTEADIAAEKIICDALRDLTPTIPIIAEEGTVKDRLTEESEYFYLVDPLDGTAGYIAGRSEYTVNIALMRNKLPFLGVIYAPALKLLYCARADSEQPEKNCLQRSYDGEKAEEIQKLPKLEADKKKNITAIINRARLDDRMLRCLAELKVDNRITMGSSLKFCVIAEGRADFYPRFGKIMEWDTAAGNAILSAVGAEIVDISNCQRLRYANKKLGYKQNGLIAYSPWMKNSIKKLISVHKAE